MRTPTGHEVYGMGAEYPSAASLYEAAKIVRDAGFKRVTNDGFFLVIEARDPRFTELGARELLERSGGQYITIVHKD